MVKIKSFFISPLWGKIFNRYNLTKIFIIFIVGFIFRVGIVFILGVNVFLEFTNCISLTYYYFMAFFAVVVHEVITYFGFCIFPKFIIDFLIGIPKISFSCLNLSSIKNIISCYLNRNKINLTNYDFNNSNFNNDIKFNNSKLYNFNSSENLSNFSKFRNKSKRILFWVFWEKYTNNFDSYKMFKETWDPNIKARTLIKKDIKDGIWKVKLYKNTIKDIWDTIFR